MLIYISIVTTLILIILILILIGSNKVTKDAQKQSNLIQNSNVLWKEEMRKEMKAIKKLIKNS